MGKYRTFETKTISSDESIDPKTVLCYGNGLCGDAKGESPRFLLLRGKSTWPKWKESVKNRRPFQHHVLLAGIFGSLFAAIPCETSSIEASTTKIVGITDSKQNLTVHEAREIPNVETAVLLAHANCTPPSSEQFPPDLFTKEQRQNGAIAVHFLALFYMLYALLLVCDEFFVPSIECICQELHVPHNIAGATFMAISTSAPELFTNVIGTFVTKGDLGLGTIVGSAVFNILAVGSCVGIGTCIKVKNAVMADDRVPGSSRSRKKGVPLDWWSLTRDSGFYLISVGVLIAVLFDGRVYWHEALIMLLLYGFYIAGMCYDTQCMQWFETLITKLRKICICECNTDLPRKLSTVIEKVLENEKSPLIRKESSERCYGSSVTVSVVTNTEQDVSESLASKSLPICSKNPKRVSLVAVVPGTNENLDDSYSFSSSDSNSSKHSTSSSGMAVGALKDILAFPIKLFLACTIPDCRKPSNRKWCAISLILCVVWIGGLSYVISWMVCIIGDTFGIPDSVSGLTFLAAGTSLPEVISSVLVARQGFGSMGLSNSIGSNTFDILVCLGLPWLIQSAILASEDSNYIEIHSGGLEYSAILLISSLILLYVIITANGYILDVKVGVSCILMYAVFIILACLLEMNVFFPVNLPPC